ncbi:MAG TPA: ferrous iron transporter B [Candidatus Faecousia intestinigallinarum]|nr:ferrous iron transporter B [Candidatus Faecousia intestinigallinarum]
MEKHALQKWTVALAGNPNVGKSTLFNNLTGMRQHTGNWPGKTVEVAQGICRWEGWELHITDLPGTYSLRGSSEDERIAGEFLDSGLADCTVVVCDGSCLERTLILALEILQRVERAVVCVNLMDEAKRQGIRLDTERLETRLGAAVVTTSAGDRAGMTRLLSAIAAACEGQQERMRPIWRDTVTEAEKIAAECTVRENAGQNWRYVLDRVLVSRRYGIPILICMLLCLVWLTVWGANLPSDMLWQFFSWGYARLSALFRFAPEWLRGLLLDGVYVTCSRVVSVMLPPMAIFFPLFTILEDVGYLPRMAFLMDHGMSRCGGCGKQALTLCMGLGCNAVGVMGCRIIDSPRERVVAILTNAMVPCNGRFPTLILLGSLFFPRVGSAFVVAACVALGVAGAMGVSGVLGKVFLRGQPSGFLMEIPPFRRPRLGKILMRSLVDRTLFIAGRAVCVAAPAGAVIWGLANTPLLQGIAAALDPLGTALGMNGVIFLGFLLALPANELLIPVILMMLTSSATLDAGIAASGALLLEAGVTWKMALCTMVFTLFHWPCTTTLQTIYRETRSWKKTAAAFLLPTAVGMVLCGMLNLLL